VTAFEAFLDDLSSSSPVPGGGSVAALSAAMGASLLCMVCNLTLGRARYASVEEQVAGIRDRVAALRDEAEALASSDEQAYGRVATAMALPRATEDDKTRRREEIQTALKGAARPPLEVMKVARQVALLADQLVEIGNRNAVSDVAVAALMASASYGAAELNVAINLAAIRDQGWVGEFRRECAAVPDPSVLTERVQGRAEEIIESNRG
jgi:formiminotetrahydrofolate cyclodeaminase